MAYGVKTFRITLNQQLILLTHMLITMIVPWLAALFFKKINPTHLAFQLVYGFLLVIDIIPTMIVHIQYWLKNRKAVLVINTAAKELIYQTPSEQLKYSFSDITLLQYYWNFGKGSGWNSFGMYRYYKIFLKDGTTIVITCLMINDIENTLETLLRMESEKHGNILCLLQ